MCVDNAYGTFERQTGVWKYLWALRPPHNVHIERFKSAEGDVGG